MNRPDLIAEFRRQVADEAQPQLWSDAEITRYLIDAQDMFVRLTGGITDSQTSAVCTVDVDEGEPFTAHSPYILRLLTGRLQTARRDVEFASLSDLKTRTYSDYGAQLSFSLNETTGTPVFGVLGVQDQSIRWSPIPVADDTCVLTVMRLPFPRMAEDNDVPLEVSDVHHLHLVKWMKHLAYSKEDAETYDKQLADRCEAGFRAYCDMAASELARQRFKPRTVRYRDV